MGALLNPVGPESARTYWIRRGLVLAVALLVVLGLIWIFSPKNPSVTAVPAPATALTPSPAASPSGTPSPSASGTPSASPSPTGPVACDPLTTKVGIAGFASVKADAKQVFTLTVENNSATPCVLQIGPSTYSVRVVSGSDPIWTTAHCAKWLPLVKKQTLQPAGTVEFQVTWPLRRSAKDCKLGKTKLGGGTYVANATYKENATTRFAFTVVG
jgi:hypothetical protein